MAYRAMSPWSWKSTAEAESTAMRGGFKAEEYRREVYPHVGTNKLHPCCYGQSTRKTDQCSKNSAITSQPVATVPTHALQLHNGCHRHDQDRARSRRLAAGHHAAGPGEHPAGEAAALPRALGATRGRMEQRYSSKEVRLMSMM